MGQVPGDNYGRAGLALHCRRVRPDTSMTGEITLSGLVFPVGGIKEKCWRRIAQVSGE